MSEQVGVETTKEPLLSGQQLIAPDGPGDSGKLICSKPDVESDSCFASPAFRLIEERRAWQQLWSPIEAAVRLAVCTAE